MPVGPAPDAFPVPGDVWISNLHLVDSGHVLVMSWTHPWYVYLLVVVLSLIMVVAPVVFVVGSLRQKEKTDRIVGVVLGVLLFVVMGSFVPRIGVSREVTVNRLARQITAVEWRALGVVKRQNDVSFDDIHHLAVAYNWADGPGLYVVEAHRNVDEVVWIADFKADPGDEGIEMAGALGDHLGEILGVPCEPPVWRWWLVD